jgi:hypothetical protein
LALVVHTIGEQAAQEAGLAVLPFFLDVGLGKAAFFCNFLNDFPVIAWNAPPLCQHTAHGTTSAAKFPANGNDSAAHKPAPSVRMDRFRCFILALKRLCGKSFLIKSAPSFLFISVKSDRQAVVLSMLSVL